MLGDACSVNTDCSTFIPFGICDSTTSKCECDTKYIGEVGTQACRVRVLNDVCRTHPNCAEAIVGATCSSGKQCVCKSGWRVNAATGTTCEKRRVWDLCNTNPDCYNAVANSECHLGVCHCLEGYRNTPNRKVCDRLSFGDECTTDRQCALTANSVCRTDGGIKLCGCADGYNLLLGASCVKRKLSDTCVKDSECVAIPNSVCSATSGRCVCVAWSRLVESMCVIRIVGDSCDKTEPLTCFGLGSGGACYAGTGTCMCGTLWYHPIADRRYCYPRYLGSPCSLDEQCTRIHQALCINNTCDCLWGRENNFKCNCKYD